MGVRACVQRRCAQGSWYEVFFFKNPHNFYSIHCHGRKVAAELTHQTELIFQSVTFSFLVWPVTTVPIPKHEGCLQHCPRRMFMQGCVTVVWRECEDRLRWNQRLCPCPVSHEWGCGRWALRMRVYSPLSSQDSDWKELRECTSDRLSRALYGWDGFSSNGFLERQGSRSTTLAKRRWQTRVTCHEGRRLSFLPCCILTRGLPGIYSMKEHWKKKKRKETSPKQNKILNTKPTNTACRLIRIEILNKPACGGDYQTTWGIKILFENGNI